MITLDFQIDILLILVFAFVFGGLLGLERVWAGKTAGMRTYALVSLGSASFIVISQIITTDFIGLVNFDPLRVTAGVITGIGFIGAGLIFVHGQKVRGLTTAAGLWVAAAIGVATGFGLLILAITITGLTLFTFTGLWFIENSLAEKKRKIIKTEEL